MQPLSKARPDVKSPKVSLFKGKESIGEEPLSPFRGSLESKRGPERSIIKSQFRYISLQFRRYKITFA